MQHQTQIDAARTEDGTYDYTACFAKVKEQISKADLAIGNFEVTLGGKPYCGYPTFSAPDEYLAAIKDAGFDLLLTANNHCLDKGKKGLERTILMLDSLRMTHIGTYLNDEFTYNEGSQFPQGEDVLDQFFRQMTPDTGMDNANNDQNIDNTVVAQAVAAAIDEIYDRTGQDSILVTHSQGGLPGWEVPLYTDHVAAIVAIEPGGAPEVDSDAYSAMVEQNIPVTFYYGDYIGEEFTDVPAAAMWSMMAASADTFTEAYNAAGGSSTVVHLPDEGITGNDHFMFQDLNNDVIADHIEAWIQENVTE